ncbi:magnesium transporter NIPA-domain-containing protein [Pyronema domesticum]|uniref:Similar to Magnesium transporter NIPA2 acc. no. Q3SWX0 n=1 Tax=Pyronema omphalodes (strain CBS 100304) TaxID=1076935 RepID=U4L6F6_PYROM|nr:magnesium transporter NIPA-domain-containing protein [Pyronema domesticum]KAI5817262.1 magnesium transporter NIPA-domain-containing protein [Pyronema omphalodes]CCX08011.1 Similar to Magnesium transporter NIPA2; acc. no. Q3SWX0 [Pyronema omphalodes CBS 100304]
MVVEDKYIGLGLAITSSIAIGTSFILTKRGLIDTANRTGFEGDGYSYFKTPIWWAGMITMGLGEISNFAAYAFAPAILVTPLGALSVLVGAVLGAYFLGEKLGSLGKLGCAICLIGSVIIVLHAPADEQIDRIDEMLNYAIQPGFLLYVSFVIAFSFIMIYKISPVYGKKNPLVYISICSTVGSLTVLSCKAFGIALKLTFAGMNQFVYPSTYVFMIVVVVCILTQMNYFNKALSQYSSSIVNPIYYVTFTTATLIASFVLFRGFNTNDPVNTISLLCGFLIIFTGVYLLNLSRTDPHGLGKDIVDDGIPTDGLSGVTSRRSMQMRRSDTFVRGSINGGRRSSVGARLLGREDEEAAVGLRDLTSTTDTDTDSDDGHRR